MIQLMKRWGNSPGRSVVALLLLGAGLAVWNSSLCSQTGSASPARSPDPAKPERGIAGSQSRRSPNKAEAELPHSKKAAQLRPPTAHRQEKLAALRALWIFPPSITLIGPRASQRIVVEAEYNDGHQEDVTAQAKLAVSNAKVASLDSEFIRPQTDGATTLTASFQGQSAEARVESKDSSTPFVWSFRNHVLPVMTKMGCNSGACHGAAAGKNGFKLTLRGYDPEVDYYTLTRQALARRTERLEPAKSLILLKPTLTVSHGGGRRFPVDSPEYRVISGWIAAGMPPPKDSDPRIQELEVLPREASLRRGSEQQLLVRANFSDGHTEDVTRWAKFASGDDTVANVDDSGHVKMVGYGEAPVTVWYLSRVTFARLRVPFPNNIEQAVFRNAPRHNYVDELVLKKLQALHIPPSRPARDSEFIRRVYLDAAGILPTPAEVERFLADQSPDKRTRLIETLLMRSEFVDYWAYKWSDLLLVSSKKLSSEGMWTYYNWIRQNVATNQPWDKFVREIITASGSALENGGANYWVIHRDPTDVSENLTQAFLGTSINCARCHNHPLDKWTQSNYYEMANLFSRVRLKTDSPESSKLGKGAILQEVTVYSSLTGELNHPRLGRPLEPRPLDGKPLPFDSPVDRRAYFAEWIASPKNPYFARALVNRVWRNFMGRGLVEPADDMRTSNPPSNQELLDTLVNDFVGHGFDVKQLIRTVLESATYQTASEPNAQNANDEKYYSHYVIRRLPAEVLLDAYSQVTQMAEKFAGYPPGMRALQLPDTAVDSYFLTAFGRPPRLQTRESERTSEPSITQALHVINGETLNRKLRAAGGTVDMLYKLGMPAERVVDYLFLAAFAHYPSESELRRILDGLREAESKPKAADAAGATDPRRNALEDLTWALLTTREFVFNH